MTTIDSSKQYPIDMNLKRSAEAEAWATKNAFGVPPEIAQIPSGTTVIIRENPNSLFRKRTAQAHPILEGGGVGRVTPDGQGTNGTKYIPPGVYLVNHGQDLSVAFWSSSDDKMRSVGLLRGRWTILIMILPEYQGQVYNKGQRFAFLEGGQKTPQVPSLQIDNWPLPDKPLRED